MDIIPQDGSLTLYCRLGGFAAMSSGTVYFDDITLFENPDRYVQAGAHVKLAINPTEKVIPDSKISAWLSNLDLVYEQYKDLMSGRTPYDGLITIRSVAGIPAWAWTTGNYDFGIEWNCDYVASELTEIASYGSWSFGIMHEMGHCFGNVGTVNGAYDFNEELFANFRMYLALTKTNGAFRATPYGASGPNMYHGYESAGFYSSFFDANTVNIDDGDNGLMWTLIRLGDAYQKNGDHGYELYKRAFDYIFSNSSPPDAGLWDNWQKFSYFMDVLSECAGNDVRQTYSSAELNVIKRHLE